jgi:NADH-quinone oxidoreductase subunit E
MLTDDERREIEATLHHYPHRQAAAGGAMRTVQRHRGWLSDETLADIGAHLGMSVDELDARATFANMLFRHPVGRHVILICDSDCCYVMAYEQMREHLSARLGIQLGETTPDGRFTFLPIVCLAQCDHAPAMQIDDDFHGDLTPERIDEILARYE